MEIRSLVCQEETKHNSVRKNKPETKQNNSHTQNQL